MATVNIPDDMIGVEVKSQLYSAKFNAETMVATLTFKVTTPDGPAFARKNLFAWNGNPKDLYEVQRIKSIFAFAGAPTDLFAKHIDWFLKDYPYQVTIKISRDNGWLVANPLKAVIMLPPGTEMTVTEKKLNSTLGRINTLYKQEQKRNEALQNEVDSLKRELQAWRDSYGKNSPLA